MIQRFHEGQDDLDDNNDEELVEKDDVIVKNTEVSPENPDKEIDKARSKAANTIRPLRRTRIQYKMFAEPHWRKGYVKEVGKDKSKDEHCGWIEEDDKVLYKRNFPDEVEEWSYLPNVTFLEEKSNDELETNRDIYLTDLLLDKEGAEELKTQEVFATLVPEKRHKEPEIVAAKQTELDNWKKYGAFEVVKDEGQPTITTRWVVNSRDSFDGMKVNIKARLCLRGFQEETVPRSDSPTAAKEMLKVVLAIAANEKWKGECLDVSAAFLQGATLERDVYVLPPLEERREGEIWKIIKAGYGLYDASRQWYLEVVEELKKRGMEKVIGDDAVFYFREDDKVHGVILLHVDDFLTVGDSIFFEKVVEKVKQRFTFGKIEKDEFRFTGIDIKFHQDGTITMKQDSYAAAINEIPIDKTEDGERTLSTEEFKAFRGITGKILWLSEQTRPDLGFDALQLSCCNRKAQVKHIREANKIVRKAKAKENILKFGHIGEHQQIKILAYCDASYCTVEDRTRSVAGKMIFMTDEEETNVNPLYWKGKTIPQVSKSAKSAETRAMDICADDAVDLARVIKQIYTGLKGRAQIPVTMKSDSKSLKDTLESTKQIQEKYLRPIVQSIKDMIVRKEIERVDWVESAACHADILTKKDAKGTDRVMEIIKTGINN